MNISLAGSIVVIDEAHNLEDACREAASGEWTRAELGEAAEAFDRMRRFNILPIAHGFFADALRGLVAWFDGAIAAGVTTRGRTGGAGGGGANAAFDPLRGCAV
jgi:Rad3-related DNA helicase